MKNAPFGALSILFPIKDNFTGSPATHSVKAFLEVINLEVVSDDWRQIQTRLDQACHLVPGFEHLTTVDTFDN